MSDLVPDHLPPETYRGPYGEFPIRPDPVTEPVRATVKAEVPRKGPLDPACLHSWLLVRREFDARMRSSSEHVCALCEARLYSYPAPDNSDPGDEQPEPSAVADKRREPEQAGLCALHGNYNAQNDREAFIALAPNAKPIRVTFDEIAAHKIAQLEARLERALTETAAVRDANELLRRERVEVEQAVGRLVHEGQLGSAVRLALHDWASHEARKDAQ